MNIKRIIIFSYFFLVLIVQVSPQTSFSGEDLRSHYNMAMDLYNKEKYVTAIRLFDAYIKDSYGKNTVKVAEAEYYAALLILKRNKKI